METFTPNARTPERIFRLSDVVRAPVRFGEERIGRLSDLIIVDRDVVAPLGGRRGLFPGPRLPTSRRSRWS